MLFEKIDAWTPLWECLGVEPGNHSFVTSVPDYSNVPSELGKFDLDSHEITNYKSL